jgi:hypothetical protein
MNMNENEIDVVVLCRYSLLDLEIDVKRYMKQGYRPLSMTNRMDDKLCVLLVKETEKLRELFSK